MAKYIRDWDDHPFETEEAAREDCAISMDWDDIVNAMEWECEASVVDLLKELARLDSPLFMKIYDTACDYYFEERYSEAEEEEDEN